MTISVISSTLASSHASSLLGPREVRKNGATQGDDTSPRGTSDASKTGDNGAAATGGDSKTANFSSKSAAESQASSDADSQDPVAQMIKQLERQLRQVMQQIQRLQASKIPEEQKAGQLQALNAEATTLQDQIANLIAKQAQAARGVITA